MIIHIVQPNDTIYSISATYGVSVTRIIQDNELVNSSNLVPGQAIVILFPTQTYVVQYGDTLNSIAAAFNVSPEQILRNNPYLADREFIYAGETLVISYNQQGSIFTNGYLLPFASTETLRKTFPFLTYLTIFNYRILNGGKILTGYDDSEMIKLAKLYGVAPFMLLSTISTRGEPNLQVTYDMLLNLDYQNQLIENTLTILKAKELYGVNLSFQFINTSNIYLFNNFLSKVSAKLKCEGYAVFVTLDPSISFTDDTLSFEKVDYTMLGQLADNVTVLQYTWSSSVGPPGPVSSIKHLEEFTEYLITMIPPNKIDLGQSIIGYDWELPYIAGSSKARSLTYDSAIILARDAGATILLDESSQTPYFKYTDATGRMPVEHIVWFVDARSINALLNLIFKYGLRGIGVWNITHYFAQLWSIINSQYEIETVVMEESVS